MNWSTFQTAVIQTVQPPPQTVIVLTQFQSFTFEGDLDVTLGRMKKLIMVAYPTANPTEIKNHTFDALLRILPDIIAEHFTIHNSAILEKDITAIQKILASRSLNVLRHSVGRTIYVRTEGGTH